MICVNGQVCRAGHCPKIIENTRKTAQKSRKQALFPANPLIFQMFYDFDDNISNRSKEWTKKSTLSFCITGIFRQKGGGNLWQEEMNMNPGSRNF